MAKAEHGQACDLFDILLPFGLTWGLMRHLLGTDLSRSLSTATGILRFKNLLGLQVVPVFAGDQRGWWFHEYEEQGWMDTGGGRLNRFIFSCMVSLHLCEEEEDK